MSQAAALRELTAIVHEHAIDVRIAIRKAGWSDQKAQRVSDFIAMGTFLALGTRDAETSFTVTDLFDEPAPTEITEEDRLGVCRHMDALRGFKTSRAWDNGWRKRPKHSFVDWPDHARPRHRLVSWEGVQIG